MTMRDEKEKWIEAVFNSVKDSKRAKPSSDLFAKIEQQISQPKAKVISMRQIALGIAAAILILIFNIFAMRQFVNQRQDFNTNVYDVVISDVSSQTLISNYKIYE